MTMAAKGVAKLIEECGELVQVLGKKLAWWNTEEPHWDGSDLTVRIQEEIADVRAAMTLVAQLLDLDFNAIRERLEVKHRLFLEWEALVDNNDHGIDG